jgi:hypothetical protein
MPPAVDPRIDELNTITPFPFAFISGCARRLSSSPAPTFAAITRDNASADTSSAGPVLKSAALFT